MRRRILVTVAAGLLCVLPAPAETDHAEVFTGRVEISTTAAGNIQVAVDDSRGTGEPDGRADHLFILQREGRGEVVSHSLESARIVFATGRLRVTAPDFELWLVLGSEADQEDSSPRGGLTVVGDGLSHHAGAFDAPVGSLAARDYFAAVEAEFPQKFLPDGSGLCDAGGTGAISCSVGGCGDEPHECSALCSGSKYACCNCTKATCKCLLI